MTRTTTLHRTVLAVAVSTGLVSVVALTDRQHPAVADEVVLDNLSVEGSVCASADGYCADGESFLTWEGGPIADLKIKDEVGPRLWFDHSNDTNEWSIGTQRGFPRYLYIQEHSSWYVTTPVVIEPGGEDEVGRFWIGPGGVGIGTTNPTRPLDVRGDPTGYTGVDLAVVTATNLSDTDELRTVFSIQNEGPPSFTLIDTSPAAADWFFRSSQSGAFSISTNASDVVDLRLAPGGDLTIGGALTQGSAAAAKHGFGPVDVTAVLDALRDLDVSRWVYDARPGVEHVGPTAEDFAAAFGLGGTDGIAAVDADGVAMAALQALADENADLAARNAALAAELTALEQRLTALDQGCGS